MFVVFQHSCYYRAKVNEAVEKVLKQQSPVKSDSSSEDSSSSSSDSETDVLVDLLQMLFIL